ncbi:60S acidic ribosomal protein P2-like protein [Tanacetum coccineum]
MATKFGATIVPFGSVGEDDISECSDQVREALGSAPHDLTGVNYQRQQDSWYAILFGLWFVEMNMDENLGRKQLIKHAYYNFRSTPTTSKDVRVKKMKVVAAYLLALLGGNTSPSAEDLKTILGSEVKGKTIRLIVSVKGKSTSVHQAAVVIQLLLSAVVVQHLATQLPNKEEEKVDEKEESGIRHGFSLIH